ncbi:MAG: haloacid dehalogenase [Desulfobacteraceae bacterium]|nr:MAG: haloacid dehalogenase [Desulfobacteraceae bacterium]
MRCGRSNGKIPPPSVAFDIDSVIADTMTLFLDIARDEFGIEGIGYEDLTAYDLSECLKIDGSVIGQIVNRIQDGGYATALKPIQGAPEILGKISECHSPILFVTARPHPGPIRGWIEERLLLPSSGIEIVATGSCDAKVNVLLERGISYFVEDRLETCYELHAAGITPILFKQPWNRCRHPFTEVGNWQELEALIDLKRPAGR